MKLRHLLSQPFTSISGGVRLIEQRGQSADHPILASMPETRYLKCFIVQEL
ncbi:MAG: hypothetical protein P0119_06660 [Nitrospira sp.]|nr:hypothetical protein [Nitrospira sp.]